VPLLPLQKLQHMSCYYSLHKTLTNPSFKMNKCMHIWELVNNFYTTYELRLIIVYKYTSLITCVWLHPENILLFVVADSDFFKSVRQIPRQQVVVGGGGVFLAVQVTSRNMAHVYNKGYANKITLCQRPARKQRVKTRVLANILA
jgi:hypothetical protein